MAKQQVEAAEKRTGPKIRATLQVCPVCDRVSGAVGQFKGYCTGPSRASHRRRRMVPMNFVEDRG